MTDLLPIVQDDRDAVQAFHRTMLDRLMDDVKSKRPKLGDDEGDAGTLVQAFARHRLLGHEAGRRDMREAAGAERLAELWYHADGFTSLAEAGTLQEPPSWIAEALVAEHSGDCTKLPWSCLRCHAEEIMPVARWVAARWPSALPTEPLGGEQP